MAIVEHGTGQKADSQAQELELNVFQSDAEISTIERPNNGTILRTRTNTSAV